MNGFWLCHMTGVAIFHHTGVRPSEIRNRLVAVSQLTVAHSQELKGGQPIDHRSGAGYPLKLSQIDKQRLN